MEDHEILFDRPFSETLNILEDQKAVLVTVERTIYPDEDTAHLLDWEVMQELTSQWGEYGHLWEYLGVVITATYVTNCGDRLVVETDVESLWGIEYVFTDSMARRVSDGYIESVTYDLMAALCDRLAAKGVAGTRDAMAARPRV